MTTSMQASSIKLHANILSSGFKHLSTTDISAKRRRPFVEMNQEYSSQQLQSNTDSLSTTKHLQNRFITPYTVHNVQSNTSKSSIIDINNQLMRVDKELMHTIPDQSRSSRTPPPDAYGAKKKLLSAHKSTQNLGQSTRMTDSKTGVQPSLPSQLQYHTAIKPSVSAYTSLLPKLDASPSSVSGQQLHAGVALRSLDEQFSLTSSKMFKPSLQNHHLHKQPTISSDELIKTQTDISVTTPSQQAHHKSMAKQTLNNTSTTNASSPMQDSTTTPSPPTSHSITSVKNAVGASPRQNIAKYTSSSLQQPKPSGVKSPIQSRVLKTFNEQEKDNYPMKLIRPLFGDQQNPNKEQQQQQQQMVMMKKSGVDFRVKSLNQISEQSPSASQKDQSGKQASSMPSMASQISSPQIAPQKIEKQKIKYPVGQGLIKTKAGQYSNYQRKENQDACILAPNFMGDHTCHLYGVYDGHGENGALVSDFVKKSMLKNITNEIKLHGGLENEDIDLPTCMRRAYLQTNKELLSQTSFDVSMSGCTAVTVLTYRLDVFCANAGDSRAMVARQTSRGEWKQVELSKDHKPECAEERNRIIAAGGRVQQSLNANGQGVGIYRVWKKNQDLPGLAMTRSMGDTVGRECGVIADPEIIKHTLTEEDKIMVVASDGVWEFLSNSDVTRLIAPFYKDSQLNEAADALVSRSHREWLKEGESVDDITCVVLFYSEIKEATII